ncbi:MAG: radical SAM protein [Firmicutes bacterium]|nr:radical SAM protein [Bacillota bacterium]
MNSAALVKTVKLPMVEIFQTVEGEGTAAGYPTVFVRLFGCPLRCAWCDTPYSYPPAEAEFTMTIGEICERVASFRAARVCVTGGEPLLYGERSGALLRAIAEMDQIVDVHVETSGAIAIAPFLTMVSSSKVRYIVDYKLPGSGEEARMDLANVTDLRSVDELKFVIASRVDYERACAVIAQYRPLGTILFSPVWGSVAPDQLVTWMLEDGLANVKLSLQIHKVIWDPQLRGV